MDIQRKSEAGKRKIRRFIYGGSALVLLGALTLGLSRLKPAAPVVDKNAVWTDTVKRGPMLREVRGTGALAPIDIRWVPTVNAGRVDRILVLPGTAVKADTVLVELSNPELEQAALESEWQLKAAEAEQENLRVQLESQRLNQEANTASLKSDYVQAELEAQADEELAKDALVSKLTMKRSRAKADELNNRYQIEEKRLKMSDDSTKAQLAVQTAKVEQLRALSALKKQQVISLKVRAGMEGVLQKLGDGLTTMQVGQQLAPGANVARIADPMRLKAEIKIPETQAKDVQLDLPVEIDTRNGKIAGRVIRIDPAVQNGTVTVDVCLQGDLPKGARPDLTVDGTVQLERLDDVLNVGRPVQGQGDSTIGIFKLTNGGREAVRVPVKLGRSSVNTIEICDGLQVGDRIILSDMSQWDACERVRLN